MRSYAPASFGAPGMTTRKEVYGRSLRQLSRTTWLSWCSIQSRRMPMEILGALAASIHGVDQVR